MTLFNAVARLDEDLLESGNAENKPENTNKSGALRFVFIAVCILIALSAAAVAADISEYHKAMAFFEDNGISVEGLNRSEVKAVYEDISSNSFKNSITADVIGQLDPDWSGRETDPTPDELATLWKRNTDPAMADLAGTASLLLKEIVEENKFRGAVAFSDRLLKSLSVSDPNAVRTADHLIAMMSLTGNVLAECCVSSDDAYSVQALTATSDGGFLFVLGFSDYQIDYETQKWASDNGFASRVIKCDRNGRIEFDVAFDSVWYDALRFCFETDDGYYLFGTYRSIEKWHDFGETDVFALLIGKDGKERKRVTLNGSDFDWVFNAERTEDGFILSVCSQSQDGDFDGIQLAAGQAYWSFRLNEQLEVIDRKAEAGRAFEDKRIGEKNGSPVYLSDSLFDNFDAGTPTAFIDYGVFYLVVSEKPTAPVPQDLTVSSILYHYETVYSAYSPSGDLVYRASSE
ncbi:MAG: hypothetical protein J5843_00570 [Clostridia bacterium]|nr:hypothetical protein [Clostridia bacterium]